MESLEVMMSLKESGGVKKSQEGFKRSLDVLRGVKRSEKELRGVKRNKWKLRGVKRS